MSTSAQISPAWKQEVNRRLAEHRGRKGATDEAPVVPQESQRNASRRAMEAAARVAARYANAPSYSELLANEARAALRAAEAASEAANQARAAAQSVLAGIEAANAPLFAPELLEPLQMMEPLEISRPMFELPPPEPVAAARHDSAAVIAATATPDLVDGFFDWQRVEPGPELVRPEVSAAPAVDFAEHRNPDQPRAEQPSTLRWDLELPAHSPEPIEARAALGKQPFATGAEDWWRPATVEVDISAAEDIELVEPLPIHANLIEFPRELVAARKARPRLVEGISAPEPGEQLSIFEVDPVSISTEVAMETVAEPAQAWSSQPVISPPTWSDMELEAQPAATIAEIAAETVAEREAASALQPAPAALRLMALVVDGALITGAVLAAAMLAATRASALPGLHAAEIGLGMALLFVAALYEALFFTLGSATPGMRYAQIRLITFEGATPMRAERRKRLVALLVSALPAGLGLVWSIFDEDHLSWHDRLSRTYLCRR